jgi:hypothetical protein
MEHLNDADFHPFDCIRLTRVRDEDGEPTDHVEIEGLRQGGMRTRAGRSLSARVSSQSGSKSGQINPIFMH